jgi:hypothetical protein
MGDSDPAAQPLRLCKFELSDDGRQHAPYLVEASPLAPWRSAGPPGAERAPQFAMTASRDSIRDVWGPRKEFAGEGRWPERVDERTTHEPERWVKSVCVLCSTGCGLEIGVKDGHIVGVRGDRLDRVNRGRLGPKGLHGWEANHSADG